MSLLTRPTTALAQRPAAVIVAAADGPLLPTYVARDLARAIINVAETTLHLLLLETLWQSGGRVTEVLRLRLSDLVEAEGALRLTNLKQRRRGQQHKLVYVSPGLLSQLRAFATDACLGSTGFFFRSRQSNTNPMSYAQNWRLIGGYAVAGDVRWWAPTARSERQMAAIFVLWSSWATRGSTRPASTRSWLTPSGAPWEIGCSGESDAHRGSLARPWAAGHSADLQARRNRAREGGCGAGASVNWERQRPIQSLDLDRARLAMEAC